MNVLIVFTHPNKESLNGAFLKNVVKGCKENGLIKDIQLLDLYEENFNPILYFDEKNKRRHMHKNPVFAKYRELLLDLPLSSRQL